MKKKITLNLFLLVIALAVNVYFRLGSVFLSFTKEQAKNAVQGEIVQGERINIRDAVSRRAKEFKSYWQDESGYTFLMEIDPYHWFRLVKNLVGRGSIGDRVIDHAEYDSFMLAPIGMRVKTSLHRNLHVYFSYYLFRGASLWHKNLSLMHFVFFIPLIISSIVLALVFFMYLSLSRSKNGFIAFLVSLGLGLTPIFLQRSQAGWFDTDAYILLFSLLSVWFFYISMNSELSNRLRILWAGAAGLCVGLFSFTWDGWWYVYDLIIFAALYYGINLYLAKKREKEKVNLNYTCTALSTFIITGAVSVSLFAGLRAFGNCLLGPINAALAKGQPENQFWPNAFLTVTELKGVHLRNFFNLVGPGYVLILSLLYLAMTFYDKKSKDFRKRQFTVFLFTAWIIATLYAALTTQRLALLLILPLYLCFGLFWERLFGLLRNIKIRQMLIALSCIFLALVFSYRASSASYVSLLMNRPWWELLNKIKTQTSPGAIINSWWDYGHWFKAVAERPVIFDGATQNTPLSYWMGRAFLTDNEREAVGILRMLNSGSNKAFEELEKSGFSKWKCMAILNEIILLKRDEARQALSGYIADKEEIEKVLGYTHNPKTAYFLVEPSLIYKMTSISFLGGWDFQKAALYEKFRNTKRQVFMEYLTKDLEFDKRQASGVYNDLRSLRENEVRNWISPTYSYYEGSRLDRKDGDLLFFKNGLVVDLGNNKVYIDDETKNKWSIPQSLFLVEGGTLKEVVFKNADNDISVLLIQDKDSYTVLPLPRNLARSMCTRLYYLKGAGLECFQQVLYQAMDRAGNHITVYKIDWDKCN